MPGPAGPVQAERRPRGRRTGVRGRLEEAAQALLPGHRGTVLPGQRETASGQRDPDPWLSVSSGSGSR